MPTTDTADTPLTPAPVPPAATPARLLVVDDDRLVLAMLSKGLRHAGYEVDTAESVEEAQGLLMAGERPDLVVLDVQLPQADGFALATRLRNLDLIPFIMLSAYSDNRTVERATSLGALGYLVKPLDIHQMVPAIEAALRRARDLHLLRTTGDQLQTALQVERDVNVAVGITMLQYRLGRDAAMDMLRAAARAQRRKLAEIAREIVTATDVLHKSLKAG